MPVLYSNTKVFSATHYTGIGTVGGFFRFDDRDGVYGISNNHVLANLNNCAIGDKIYSTDKEIGTLSSWKVLQTNSSNTLDVCLFRLRNDVKHAWLPLPNGLIKPVSFALPLIHGHVYMQKATGLRTGYINRQVNQVSEFYFRNDAGDEIRLPFTGLYEVISFDGNAFSEPGDSGSIIFSSKGCIVGLLMGSQEHSAKSYFVAFADNILKTFPLIIA